MIFKRIINKTFFARTIVLSCVVCIILCGTLPQKTALAEMPFYNLCPAEITERAQFYTSYPASSEERKHNIKLAAQSIDDTFIDVGAEFSFNIVVGKRTEENGYKKAKIIYNGEFVDGIGGGVCQVSTTLYNAVLLAGLKITEFHPHSLPVSYVAPSFDAMVNFYGSDLKFVNDTKNPIIIKAKADDAILRVTVYGEPMAEKYVRQSRVIKEIIAEPARIIKDEKGEYPDLFVGERKIVSYSKNGYVSEGILIKTLNGKPVSSKLIRSDTYAPVCGVIIEGTQPKSERYLP